MDAKPRTERGRRGRRKRAARVTVTAPMRRRRMRWRERWRERWERKGVLRRDRRLGRSRRGATEAGSDKVDPVSRGWRRRGKLRVFAQRMCVYECNNRSSMDRTDAREEEPPCPREVDAHFEARKRRLSTEVQVEVAACVFGVAVVVQRLKGKASQPREERKEEARSTPCRGSKAAKGLARRRCGCCRPARQPVAPSRSPRGPSRASCTSRAPSGGSSSPASCPRRVARGARTRRPCDHATVAPRACCALCGCLYGRRD